MPQSLKMEHDPYFGTPKNGQVNAAYCAYIVMPTQEDMDALKNVDALTKAELGFEIDGKVYKTSRAALHHWLASAPQFIEISDFSHVPVHTQLYMKASS